MQNYNLFEPDRYIVSSGSQNVSFSFHDDGFHQRIDRTLVASGKASGLSKPEIPFVIDHPCVRNGMLTTES